MTLRLKPLLMTMTQREHDRIKLITQLSEGSLTLEEVQRLLRLSERQVYRLLERHRTAGDAGLIHGLRGRSSNHSCA